MVAARAPAAHQQVDCPEREPPHHQTPQTEGDQRDSHGVGPVQQIPRLGR